MLAEVVSPVTNSGPLVLVWPVADVAVSEQARIKMRAAEAGLSASAYLCPCALEVEQLRAQVQHTLAVIERSSRLALSAGEPPAQVPVPRFLERMRRRIFGGGTDRLALRA